MELISSMLSIVKNVSDTDREFKLLRQKLVYNIKKGEAALAKYHKEHHVQAWVAEHLERRLCDAREKQTSLDTLLSSSNTQGISLKDKFKLSLPFNNERDKINQIIDDLKNACEEVMNGNIPQDPLSAFKRKLETNDKGKQEAQRAMERERQKEQLQVDSQIDEMYEMGPTIQQNNVMDFAHEYTRTHTIELRVEALGEENILKTLQAKNRTSVIEHTCERTSKEASIELFKLGRLNFKGEYKALRQAYPDIDKVSKNAHFTIQWLRAVPHVDRSQLSQGSNKKTQQLEVSQKKEEGDQFFSVAQVEHAQLQNGQVVLDKEKRSLYRKRGEKWMKVEEERLEISNGEEVAVCLGKNLCPDLYFKISYEWK